MSIHCPGAGDGPRLSRHFFETSFGRMFVFEERLRGIPIRKHAMPLMKMSLGCRAQELQMLRNWQHQSATHSLSFLLPGLQKRME